MLTEEFLAKELDEGRITSDSFTENVERVRMHGHCFQKALSSLVPLKKILMLPQNYTVLNIPSGCCGMAGSFGCEKEHYDISMKIGELVLFPAIRSEKEATLISASGTSCRHQISDGTSRKAFHPVEILYKALK
jgi:Fe-S oxidoreductase